MSSFSDPRDISIKDYTYVLPDEKIAKFPLKARDASKLLIYQEGKIQVDQFTNLAQYLEQNTLLVFNTTKVVKARLLFKNNKYQRIEIFCLEPAVENLDISIAIGSIARVEWNCLVGNLKQWKETELVLEKDHVSLKAGIKEKLNNHVVVEFTWLPSELHFAEILQHFGEVPIPPYLDRQSELSDIDNYQTIYAKEEGSVAAPTSGLHFTETVLETLKKKGIHQTTLNLHVGAGTFKPVKSETLIGHDMHAEWMEVSVTLINTLKNSLEKKVIAVGTTSCRTLESLYWMGLKLSLNPDLTVNELEVKQWEAYELAEHKISQQIAFKALLQWMEKKMLQRLLCKTHILIAPPYKLQVVNGIITNFHQPQSTLLLLISTVVGENWKTIYEYALNNDFRFLSYGDASLLLK